MSSLTATIPSTTVSPGTEDRSRRVRNVGLLPRVVLALALVGLLPLLFASSRLSTVNREALAEQVLRSHALAARTAAARIDAAVASRRSLVELLADELSAVPPDELRPALARLLGATWEVGGMAAGVVDSTGRNTIRAQREDIAPFAERLLESAPEQPLTVTSLEDSAWLRVSAPMNAHSRLALVFEVPDLLQAVRPEELGASATMLLAQAGEVLLGPAESLATFPPPLLDAAASLQVSGSGRFSTPTDDVLGAYSPIAGTTWFVASRQPADIAQEVAVEMRRQAAIAIVGALALASILSLIAFRTLVRPIRGMLDEHSRLLGQQVSSSGNEIDRLRAAFAALALHVRQKGELDHVFLGPYEVVEMLGEGAMGSVFMGWDPRLRRPVALKTLKISGTAQPLSTAGVDTDLLAEAITTAHLNHPNIVSVYDIEETPEFCYIAMEFVSGGSLRAYLQRHERLPLGEVILVSLGVARALAAAHGHKTLHNDIKPANVLLRLDGIVKVTDFGISQVISSVSGESDLIVGTPGFVPPEVLGGGPRDERADLFALGVLSYECATGCRPFEAESLPEVVAKTLNHEPRLVHSIRPEVPMELSLLIDELITKDPDRRPPTAEDVVARLESIADDHSAEWSLLFEGGKSHFEENAEKQDQLLGSIGGPPPSLIKTRPIEP